MSCNFSVEIRGGEPFEKTLRRFSAKLRKTGVLQDIKRRRFFVKPSVQKKIDRQKSIRRLQKAQRLGR